MPTCTQKMTLCFFASNPGLKKFQVHFIITDSERFSLSTLPWFCVWTCVLRSTKMPCHSKLGLTPLGHRNITAAKRERVHNKWKRSTWFILLLFRMH